MKEFYSYFQSIYGLIIIARPIDGVIIGSSVVLGLIVGLQAIPSLDKIVLGFLGGFFLLAGMDTFNDYYDLKIDKISKPWRPLPRGIVTPRLALTASLVETSLAVLIGIYAGIQVLSLGIIVVIIAVSYSKWLKPYFITKNLVVSISLSMASVTGFIAVKPDLSVYPIFAIVLLLVLVASFTFEVHKDLGDIDGDLKHNIQTIPTKLGINRTIQFVMAGYLVAWIIAFTLLVIIKINIIYILILAITLLLCVYIVFLLRKGAQKNIELTRRIATFMMGLVLLGLSFLFV